MNFYCDNYRLVNNIGLRYERKMLFFIIVLCTSTNMVQQMIENLHASVQVGSKILLALRKKYIVHALMCKCACVESSTVLNIAFLTKMFK